MEEDIKLSLKSTTVAIMVEAIKVLLRNTMEVVIQCNIINNQAMLLKSMLLSNIISQDMVVHHLCTINNQDMVAHLCISNQDMVAHQCINSNQDMVVNQDTVVNHNQDMAVNQVMEVNHNQDMEVSHINP